MSNWNIQPRFRDFYRNLIQEEQKLDDVIQYVDFLQDCKHPIILMKDGSLLILFQLDGFDYEGLSEESKEDFSYAARSALEQLPDEGAGFMISNLLIRDTPKPVPLVTNPAAPQLIRFIQGKKQAYWNDLISKSFSNRILCGLRYFPVGRKEAPLFSLISENRTHIFYDDQLCSSAERLEQGFITLSSGLERFGFRAINREETFSALYELVNFAEPPIYRSDLSLNVQLAHSNYEFFSDNEYAVVNKTEYISLIGVKYLPPSSVAMYLRRFYELGFPLVMRQAIGFVNKERLFKDQNFNLPIAMALSALDSKNLAYVDEVKAFRDRIENNKEFPVYWHFSILVRANDSDTLRVRRAEVVALLKEIGSYGVAESSNLQAGMLSMWPGHDRFYLRSSLVLTANVGDLLSAYVLYPGDSSPVDYLQDRLQGVFAYDPFTSREKAHHRAICGPTAGGKSFFAIKDLISHLIVNPMVWVVDLSASYLDLFELLQEEMPGETSIMRVSRENSNFAFNPFLIKDPRLPVSEEQFEFCMGFLKLMAGAGLCTPENESAMREGLKLFFHAYGTLLSSQVEQKPFPPLNLLVKIMKVKIRSSALSAAFSLWKEGWRGKLFNTGRDTLQSARYCYFDLRDLEGEPGLTTAVVYVIFSKVYRDIADERLRPVQKRFILDEAHRYIADPAFSFWIELLMRTGRHSNIMMDLITQSINDLQSNAILTNLKQAFMFPGQKNIEDSFAGLQLTDYHIEQYKKLNPSRYEVLYWSDGGLRRMLRSVADPYTYWLATTDARERDMKRRMKERFGNVKDAIEELVRVTAGCQTAADRLLALKTYFGDETNHEKDPD